MPDEHLSKIRHTNILFDKYLAMEELEECACVVGNGGSKFVLGFNKNIGILVTKGNVLLIRKCDISLQYDDIICLKCGTPRDEAMLRSAFSVSCFYCDSGVFVSNRSLRGHMCIYAHDTILGKSKLRPWLLPSSFVLVSIQRILKIIIRLYGGLTANVNRSTDLLYEEFTHCDYLIVCRIVPRIFSCIEMKIDCLVTESSLFPSRKHMNRTICSETPRVPLWPFDELTYKSTNQLDTSGIIVVLRKFHEYAVKEHYPHFCQEMTLLYELLQRFMVDKNENISSNKEGFEFTPEWDPFDFLNGNYDSIEFPEPESFYMMVEEVLTRISTGNYFLHLHALFDLQLCCYVYLVGRAVVDSSFFIDGHNIFMIDNEFKPPDKIKKYAQVYDMLRKEYGRSSQEKS